MRDIASQKKIPVLHRCIDDGAQGNEVFVVDLRIFDSVIAEPQPDFFPEPLVGPVLSTVTECALQVITAPMGPARQLRNKTVIADAHDRMSGDRCLNERSEPRITELMCVLGQYAIRDRRPANATVTVASDDVVADELV
jgi:hypothetical protein